MEYEYCYKVDDLKEYINYLNENYKYINSYEERRTIYRNSKHLRNIGHIKDLYCYKCKCNTKHYEVKNKSQERKLPITATKPGTSMCY